MKTLSTILLLLAVNLAQAWPYEYHSLPLLELDSQYVTYNWLPAEIDGHNRTFVPNGCPSGVVSAFEFTGFRQQCNVHDLEYAILGMPKDTADSNLKRNLERECYEHETFMLPYCLVSAMLFHQAVQLGGHSAYQNAQNATKNKIKEQADKWRNYLAAKDNPFFFVPKPDLYSPAHTSIITGDHSSTRWMYSFLIHKHYIDVLKSVYEMRDGTWLDYSYPAPRFTEGVKTGDLWVLLDEVVGQSTTDWRNQVMTKYKLKWCSQQNRAISIWDTIEYCI